MRSKKSNTVLLNMFVAVLLVMFTFGSAQAGKKKVIELRFASHIPPVLSTHKVWEQWAQKVEERTEGRVKITFYPAGTLVKGKEIYQALIRGVCDITYLVNIMDASRFALNMIIDMPVMGWADAEVASRVRKDLYNKFPEIRDEFKGVKVLWQYAALPHSIHLKKKTIAVPQDIKNLKILGIGINSKVLQSLGASPVSVMPSEWYMALNRGVAEGALAPYNVLYGHKSLEMVPYHYDMVINYAGSQVMMNEKIWNKLPADIQKIFNELEPWVTQKHIETNMAGQNRAKEAAIKMKHTIIHPTADQIAQWREGVKPVQEGWITENEAKGRPARAIFEEAQRLIKVYSK